MRFNWLSTTKFAWIGFLGLLALPVLAQDADRSVRIQLDVSKTLINNLFYKRAYAFEPSVSILVADKWHLSFAPGYAYVHSQNRTRQDYYSRGFFGKAGFENSISGRFEWSARLVASQLNEKESFLLKGNYYGDTTLIVIAPRQTWALGLELGLSYRVPVGMYWNLVYQARMVFYGGTRSGTRYIPGMGTNGEVVTGGLSLALEYKVLGRKKAQ